MFSSTHGFQCDSEYNYIPGYIIQDESNYTSHEIGTLEAAISFPEPAILKGTRGSGIIRCRKPGILAKIELRIPFQRPIRFLPETDYPRASRSFPRIAGSGNEIVEAVDSEILGDYDAYCLYADEPLASQECYARYL